MSRKKRGKDKYLEKLQKIAENTTPKKEKLIVKVSFLVAIVASVMAILGLPSINQFFHNLYQQKAEQYNNEGLALFNQGKYEEAIQYYDQSIALERHGIENMDSCYFNRGYAYYKLGDYEKAIEDYTAALNIAEKSKYYSHRGLAYAKIGDNQNAYEDDFRAAMLGLSK